MDRVVLNAMRQQQPLADAHWTVLKKREEYDAELQRFRAEQSERVASVNRKQNEVARRLHERIFVALRWAHPKPANTYSELVLEYCVHLTGSTPDAEFPKQHQLDAWRQRLQGGALEKLLVQIDGLCLKLRNAVMSRNEQITVTNQTTAETVEKLQVDRDVKLSWIKNAIIGMRDKFRTIWYYSSNNQLEGLKRYFCAKDRQQDVNDPDPEYGFTALHYACMKGHFDIAMFLMENGADIHIPATGDGRTPLHLAAAYSGKQLVLELLARGADENAIDNFGFTPLILARQNKNAPAVKVLENWSKLLLVDSERPADGGGDAEHHHDGDAAAADDDDDGTAKTVHEDFNLPRSSAANMNSFSIDGVAMSKMSPTLRFLSERLQGTPSVSVDSVFDVLLKRESFASNNNDANKLLVTIRMCDRHANMCIEEGFVPQALQSFRRRWSALFAYLMEADMSGLGSNSVHSGLSAQSNPMKNPISVRFAVEVAMDAVEFSISHGFFLEAEATLSECLLLKEFRFLTLPSYEENFALFEEEYEPPIRSTRRSSVDGGPSADSTGTDGTDSTLPSVRVKDSDDIGSLKRRIVLRHCEVLLYLHDMASMKMSDASDKPLPRECSVGTMIEWLRRRSEYEALLLETLATREHSMSQVMDSSRTRSVSIKGMSGTETQASVTELSVPGPGSHELMGLREAPSPGIKESSVISFHRNIPEEEQLSIEIGAHAGDASKIAEDSFYLPPSQSVVRFQEDTSHWNVETHVPASREEPSFADVDRSVWSYSNIDNPGDVRSTYQQVLLQVCVSNALETIRVFVAGDEYNAFIIEPLALAPALEILSEALDRQGKPDLAMEHASHASVVFERSLGPLSVDCIRCAIEAVRLRLRCFMGGAWGHQYDSQADVRATSSKLGSRSSSVSAATSKGKRSHAPPPSEDLAMPSTFINDTLASVRTQAFLRSHPDGAPKAAVGGGAGGFVQVDAESSRILTELFQREHSLEYYRHRFEEAEGINRAAADVIDRVSQLSSTDPAAADTLMNKSINMVAMAELLLSEARTRLKVKRKDEHEKRWVPKVKTHVSIALSDIIAQRRHGSSSSMMAPSSSTGTHHSHAPPSEPSRAAPHRTGKHGAASTSASSSSGRRSELKVPRFSKQSLPHHMNPQLGNEASIWASQFASASIVSTDAATVMLGGQSILDQLVEPVVNVSLDKRSSSRGGRKKAPRS